MFQTTNQNGVAKRKPSMSSPVGKGRRHGCKICPSYFNKPHRQNPKVDPKWSEVRLRALESEDQHGSLNVPIEHHPTIRYIVYNGYYKVMSNIPKMGQLPTPDQT